jgi:sugar O-acyltransferase (sialic acid O-acetyltransferase NeuD family)
MAVLIRQINRVCEMWDLVGFYDDAAKGKQVGEWPVLGCIDDLINHPPVSVLLAVGDPIAKQRIWGKIQNANHDFPTLVHPSATLGENISLGPGVVIAAGCRLTVDIKVGSFVLLNLNCTVGHDVVLDSFSSIMPGVHLSGGVSVGEACLVGTGASVLQNLRVGARAAVGAGAVVTRSVNDGAVFVGVPARPMPQ